MSETWEQGLHPAQAEVHEPVHEEFEDQLRREENEKREISGLAPLTREQFQREIDSMVGELRQVKIDVGSFLALSTEATNEQRLALARLIHRYRRSVDSVRCTMGGAGLPRDYVLFDLLDEQGGLVLEGGIDPEGRVST